MIYTARNIALAFALLGTTSVLAQNAPATPSLAAPGESVEAAPSLDVLQQQIKSLQAKVEELQRDKVSAADVDAIIERVMKDANQRSQLFQTDGTLTAGYDKGFFIRSPDGKFLMKPGIQTQFRYVANHADGAKDDDRDQLDAGFEVRRLRVRFDGNVFTENLTYSIQLDENRVGGNVQLLEYSAAYQFKPDWYIKFGQYKQRFLHEHDIQPFSVMAVETSLLDNTIGGRLTDYIQGVSLIYGGNKTNDFRVEVVASDGASSINTDFRDGPAGPSYGFGARAEWKVFGDWKNYSDPTAKGTKEPLLVIGSGIDYSSYEDRDQGLFNVDAQYEHTSGLGLYGAVVMRTDLNRNEAGDRDDTDYGGLAQVSYALGSHLEPFARYSIVKFESDASENVLNEMTVGANYYFGPDGAYLHRAKFTLDVGYLPDGAPAGVTGAGYVPSDESQFLVRAQLTLQL